MHVITFKGDGFYRNIKRTSILRKHVDYIQYVTDPKYEWEHLFHVKYFCENIYFTLNFPYFDIILYA